MMISLLYIIINQLYYNISEQEMMKEQINSLKALKSKLMQRITDLEEELKQTKEEAEKLAKSNKSDDEASNILKIVRQYCSSSFHQITFMIFAGRCAHGPT